MEAHTKKYDNMVDYYDGMLRERSLDMKELEAKVIQHGGEDSREHGMDRPDGQPERASGNYRGD